MPKSSHVPEIEFIALIATLMALVALAINMILPAFAVMTTDFELSTSTQIGLVVSLLYVGLAVGQITFGALSDSIGRKPAMNAGLMIFVVGAALSWGGPTFEVLIAGQIIQGMSVVIVNHTNEPEPSNAQTALMSQLYDDGHVNLKNRY